MSPVLRLIRRVCQAARSAGAWALLAAGLCVGGSAPAAAPTAGTVIANVAEASFFDTDSGYHVRLRSNAVHAVVRAQEALMLAPAHQLLAPIGGVVRFPHRLSNTGNTASEVVLQLANADGDAFDLLDLRLVHDINGNGQADAGEPQIAAGSRFGPLAAGASTDFVVTGRLPATAVLGQSAAVGFSATSVAQGVVAGLSDGVTVGDGALLQVVSTVSHTEARPGQALRFSLVATNNGNRAATGVPVQVDGVTVMLALLRSVVPANTRLEAAGPAGPSRVLYHLRGAPPHSYVTTPPPDLAAVDAIAFGFPDAIARGQTVSRSFDVRVNSNASARIVGNAQFVFNDGMAAAPVVSDSNAVLVAVPMLPPNIEYYADAGYTQLMRVMPVGRKFYLNVDASQCNFDPQAVETRRLTIRSALTGDVESFLALETNANSGVFRVDPHVQSVDFGGQPPIHGDGLVSTGRDDRIVTAMEGCGVAQVEIDLLIDPFGVVFDSRSNLPLAGAVLRLIDVTGAGNGGRPGGPARVLETDAVTPAPSTVTTGADGRYAFPLVPPSEYRLDVTAPAGYLFPSVQPPALQPTGRLVHAQGSYGQSFPVNAQTGAIEMDVPLDGNTRSGLFIEKSAARNIVELGDFLDYTVRVKNVADQLLGRVRVTDRLPAGFAYVRGSARLNGGVARLDGSALPEPAGGVGPVLTFEVGSIPDQATLTLSYRVRVGVGALQGDGINRVLATTPAPLNKVSNEASAAVQVLPGVFSDRGFLVGKVHSDCRAEDGRTFAQHDGPGVPGVRIYLQDGTHVTTDRDGRYSLYGLAARTHVAKLDATTLAGLRPRVTEHRQARDAASRFVDIKRGELHRADFVLEGCTVEIGKLITARRQAAEAERGETEHLAAARFSTEPVATQDPRSLPAAGTVGSGGPRGLPGTPPAVRGGAAEPGPAPRPAADGISALMNEDEIAALVDNHLEIVNLRAGQSILQPQATVIVKGALDMRLRLTVNGTELGAHRVGRRTTVAEKKLQVWEFVGVNFEPGRNQLQFEQIDAEGRVRESHMIVVIAPGRLAGLRITPARDRPAADGRTPLAVTIETVDANGVVIGARTPVTLDTALAVAPRAGVTAASWQARDLHPEEPGIQIFVEGGTSVIDVLPPGEPGDVLLKASAGAVSGQARVSFQPDLRPLMAVGIVEGVLDLRRLDRSALQPARAQDGFEQELRSLATEFGGGRARAGARASLFLKGRVRGDVLLTLGYDSEKASTERLFRDIQPDAYYAVYGDSSVKGFDAQSTGRLYVRLDHSRFYALLGDFTTQAQGAGDVGDRRLGQYARSLNGVQGQLRSRDARSEVGGFASRAASRLVVAELPALGISGPYLLAQSPFVENSEKVEIVTRDRELPTRIIKTVAATRFVDYQVEPLTGRLLFRAPVPGLDADFNPNFIRVSYEVAQGGDAFWVAGAHARHKLNERLTVSGALVKDDNPQDPLQLASAQVRVGFDDRTALGAEVAQADRGVTKGRAVRLEFRHEGALVQAHAHATRSDPGFDNPSAGVSRGQDERVARGSVRIDPETVLKGELQHAKDLGTQARRVGAQIAAERQLTPELRGELGLRHSEVSGPAAGPTANAESTTVRLRLQAQLPGWGQASLFAEAEQDIADDSRRLLAMGGEMRLAGGLRVYGRHEVISTLGPRLGLSDAQPRNATVLGVSGEPFADAQAFGEYRLRNALSSREAEAAMGLRQRWTLGEGLSASAGIERVTALGGGDLAESTSITSGLEFNDGSDWRAAGRLELRVSSQGDSLLNTLSAARRLGEAWTLLARNALSITRGADGSRRSDDWLQTGLAYRDNEQHRWNGLLRAEYRGERAHAADGVDTGRDAVILSAHANHQWQPGAALSARYAAKWVRDDGRLGVAGRSRSQLLAARLSRDLGEDWNASVHGSLLAGHGARQHGLGLELGYLVSRNLWLSGGYNVFGFRDRELAGPDHTHPGAYLRLSFKFDEASF